jgi:TPR repeat protein
MSLPINDLADAHEELAEEETEAYYSCCGKSICNGCLHSFRKSGNDEKCPFCNSDGSGKTDEDGVVETTKRAEANDPYSMHVLAHYYYHGLGGMQQNREKALELLTRSAGFGCSKAHNNMSLHYYEGGYMKKAKFHYEAAAMAGNEVGRSNIGIIEFESGNIERAVKHWKIAASAGHYTAMFQLKTCFENSLVSRESIDSTLEAYNNSCAEMRSEARDAYIRVIIEVI